MSKEATVSDPRGLKRICTNCGTRFFDLNKRPIVCPQCDTEFTGEVKIKNRRGRLAADDTTEEDQISEAKESDDEDLIEDEVAEADTVSLEEVEEIDGDDDDDEKLDSDDIDSNLDDDLDADLDDLDDDEDLDVDLEEEDK